MIKFLRPALFPCLAICIAAFASQCYAEAPPPPSATDTVDASSRVQIVTALADRMRDLYVFPNIAGKVEKTLRQKLKDGDYDSLKYAVGLASELTRDLQMISHDLHLRVDYFSLPLPFPSPDNASTADEEAATLKQLKASNFGVGTVEKLPGNIGYLQIHAFAPAKYAKQTISTAMTHLADSAALIIDIRPNGSGDPKTAALLSSYLFDKRTHLGDDYGRDGKRKEQFWTYENVYGPKFGQSKPVYVLMSRDTFSAGEEFGYNLKSLKRATLVGEVSAGGAHGGDYRRLHGNFYAFIPDTRAVNPITKTNWERTGVEPDVRVSAQIALLVAQKLAVRILSAAEKNPRQLLLLHGRLGELDSQLVLAAGPVGR